MSVPLCVDLDGTLIKTDSLWESWLLLLKKNPLYFFLSCLWLCFGINYLKFAVSNRVQLNPVSLPYSKQFIDYLREEFNHGRKLILVTAADERIANAIANHLGIFSAVFGSNKKINLKGKNKKKFLNNLCGEKTYDYAANAKVDLAIWNSARSAIIVNANSRITKKVSKICPIEKVFPNETKSFVSVLKTLRIHHYVKNILIFVPLIASHSYNNLPAIIHSCIGFVAFCLLASVIYLINDLLDLETDRHHPVKNKRAFAAGNLSIFSGILLIVFLSCAAFSIALRLNTFFSELLLVYFFVSNAYSIYFKKQVLVDVFILAFLYTLRITAGIVILHCDYSEWLITFSLFFFLSLALLKRYIELFEIKKANKLHILGRGYKIDDLAQVGTLGTVSGYMAILVLALYINSSKVMILYSHPDWLWLVCLLLLYWISRIWILASRGEMHDDPVVFMMTDKISLFIAFLSLGTVFFAAGGV